VVAPWRCRGTNLIALGDFNIDRQGDPLYDAFTSTGLRPPDPLNFVPRTVFDDPAVAPDRHHFYDQIARFIRTDGTPHLSVGYRNAGMYNFANNLIPADTTTQPSWRISDLFPLWCELTT